MVILRLALISLVVLIVVPVQPATASERATVPHIRPLDAGLEELVALGMRDSPSFRTLVARLEASDVVVYLRWARRLRAHLTSQLTFVGTSSALRYVDVAVDRAAARDRLVATIGHELRHAVEIAETPAIVDARSLGEAYARMGRTSRVEFHPRFETEAAVETGRLVWRELVGRASQTAAAAE